MFETFSNPLATMNVLHRHDDGVVAIDLVEHAGDLWARKLLCEGHDNGMEERGLLGEAISWGLGKLLSFAVVERGGIARTASASDAWLMSYLEGLRPVTAADLAGLHLDSLTNMAQMLVLDALVFNEDRVHRNVQGTETTGGFLVRIVEMDCARVGAEFDFVSTRLDEPMGATKANNLLRLCFQWNEVREHALSLAERAAGLPPDSVHRLVETVYERAGKDINSRPVSNVLVERCQHATAVVTAFTQPLAPA